MREKDGYREQLECVLAFTGGRQLLTLAEVKQYTGLKDNRTVKSRFPFVNGYIAATELARKIIGG